MATSKFHPETKTWSVEKGPHDKILSDVLDLGATILKQLDKYLPSKILEIHCETETSLTVAQIKQRSISCAHNLLKNGIKQGDVVVIFSQVNKDVAPVILGSLLIGAVFNTFETTFSNDDAKFSLKTLRPKAIVYDPKFEDQILKCCNVNNLKIFLPFGDGVNSVFEKLLNGQEMSFTPPKLTQPINKLPACMVFTSGSTGRPKAVIISHSLLKRGMLTFCTVYQNDIVFAASPLRWISHILFLLQIIYYGATRIITCTPTDAELFCTFIKKHRVNKFFGVVGLVSQMISIAKEKSPGCLDSLTYIISGGEVVSQKLRLEITTLLRNVKLVSVYGMSELAGVVAGNEFCEDKLINGGYLKYGLQFKVVDQDYNPLDKGEKGVLCIKYDGGFLGYQNNDKANQEAFFEGGWYYTGDFVKISSNGMIEVYGRFKDNIWCDGKLVRDSKIL
ncbi:hypothetical protein ACFFRR_001928 [Megaselia abdita]